LVILGVACTGKPPLRIAKIPNGIGVDVQTLGEYPTTISRIRLSDAQSGQAIWEVHAARDSQPGGPQLSRFSLSAGPNPARIEAVMAGSYDVVVPPHSDRFVLQRHVRYKLTLWGSSGNTSRAIFQIE
jgi:hypothetical protein